MTDLVTGEAVVLELRLAKLPSRALSLSIDLAVQFGLFFVGSLVVGGIAVSVDEALGGALLLVFIVLVIVGYPVAFETLTRGRSLGKLALGLRVVRDDGGPVRFRHAFVRGLVGVVDFWISVGSVALITSLASARGKRLGDFLAGTVVIRERVPMHGAAVTPMPPQLAGWARGLDLSRLPDDLALAARQYLARIHELAPDVRDSMGHRLAAAVAGVITPPPPPGVPAWAYLAAVLAERRNRELARMQPARSGWGPAPYGAPSPAAPPYGAPSPAAPPYDVRASPPYGVTPSPPYGVAAPPPEQPDDQPGPFAPPG